MPHFPRESPFYNSSQRGIGIISYGKWENHYFLIKGTVLYFSCKLEIQYKTHGESFFIQSVEYNEFYPAEAVDVLTIWMLPGGLFLFGFCRIEILRCIEIGEV